MQRRIGVVWLVLLPLAAHADNRLGGSGATAHAGTAPPALSIAWPLGPQLLSASLGVMPAHTTLSLQPLLLARGRGVRLLGNYDLNGGAPWAGLPTGFRASSGILLQGATSALRTIGRDPASSAVDEAQRWGNASSYVGLGYTNAWQHGGLRFSADLGLSSPLPGAPLEAGYSPGNAASLGDDTWRLRSGPLLQLGVDYSF